MLPLNRFVHMVAGLAAMVAFVLAARVGAQGLPVLVLIDGDSIGVGLPPNAFEAYELAADLADIGVRDNLPVFTRKAGNTVILQTGNGANAGWHTLPSVPASWRSGPGENDGLLNYFLAGPGLGSPEGNGERTRFLHSARPTAMSAAAISALQGRIICGVVYQGDLTATGPPADLSGPTLGVVAFQVEEVTVGGSFPDVKVNVLVAEDVCQTQLALP